jgi:hypothetical protein
MNEEALIRAREKKRDSARRLRAVNPEKSRAASRKWKEKNPLKRRIDHGLFVIEKDGEKLTGRRIGKEWKRTLMP